MNYVQLDTFLIAWQERRGHTILTPKRRNQKVQNPATLDGLLKRARARTLWGLWVRVLAKLTAHTLGVVLNRHFGYDPLALKALVFGHG